ncbi:hypothetical protein BH23GEM4_BH23GEM4_00940 [soil metagenome]
MYCKTTVKVVHDGAGDPLSGARVSLYDRDWLTSDDLLGTGITDASGEACFSYAAEAWMDLDDHIGGSAPELYVVVHGVDGEPIVNTRAQAVSNRHRRQITVAVPEGLVREAGQIAPTV